MSGYVRQITIQAQFEGAPVRVVLKPLTRGDLFELQALLPILPRLADGRVDMDKVKAGEMIGDASASFALYAKKLPGYVLEADVRDAAGEPVSVAEWCEAAYFTALVGDLMSAHMDKASPENPLLSAARLERSGVSA